MPEEEYKFEQLAPGHYPFLQQLFLCCFNLKLSADEIARRFDTAALGGEVTGFIAIHTPTNLPAAYYGVFPMKAVVNDKVIQIAQSGDTMTHPAHQRKGLYVKLATLTYAVCQKKKIELLIGQPNQFSYHGLVNKLGWMQRDELVRWDLKQKIKTIPLFKLFRRLSFLSGLFRANVNSRIGKYQIHEPSTFQNQIASSHAKIWRDEKYLAYKKSDDKFFIKINRVSLWIQLTDIFWIGDFDNYEAIDRDTIRKLKKLAWWLGYNTISFNLNRSVPLPVALRIFKENSAQASCFLYFNEQYRNLNFILTAADSDTW